MAEKIIVDDEYNYYGPTQREEATRGKTNNAVRADKTHEFPRLPYSHQSSVNKTSRGGRKNYVYTGGGDKIVDYVDAIPASRRSSSQYGKTSVHETISGHTIEYDDTPGSERIMIYHKTGSGVELLADGTSIYSSVGNTVRVVQKDEKVVVEGDAHLSYNGNLTLDVSGDFNVKVGGNYNVEVGGNEVRKTDGSVGVTIGKKHQKTVKGNEVSMVAGSITDQTLGSRYSVTKGVFTVLAEGDYIQACKGTLSLTSEDEVILSSPDMNIAANDLSVFGATGTFGGDTITGYFQNVFCKSGSFTEGVTAPTFHGDLTGRADEAIASDTAVYASYGGGPGSAENWTNTNTATDLTETARPTSAILSDYLDNSDRAYIRVSIDPGDYMKKAINRSDFYGGITDKDPNISEVRALLKDPDNTNNDTFLGNLLAAGKISSLYSNVVPLYTGRQVNPVDALLTGSTNLGQTTRGGSKQFTMGTNTRLEDQLKKRGL